MPRIKPLDPDQLPEDLKAIFEQSKVTMGFVANDVLTMALKPDLLRAMSGVVAAVYGPGEIDPSFKPLIGEIASKSAGCLYCMAHTAHGAALSGVSQDKIDAVWDFELSELFSEAEKAALNFAMLAGQSPSGVGDDDFARLKTHYSDVQIVEIMSVISLFGFLNRWNDSLGTMLEDIPKEFAKENLSDKGWILGKHD
jgi:uncharacterized peroxidase-related enzyme